MPACLTRALGFAALTSSASCLKMQDDHSKVITSSSLRRSLSANMSSEKWMTQSGLKKVASSENLHIQEVENGGFGSGPIEQVWSSIQRGNNNSDGGEIEKPRRCQTDIWSSILSQKAKDDEANKSNLPPPYVHPLVKRSSSLSEKSLQICTESLGSETGSDGFSSACNSEQEDNKDIVEAEPLQKEKVVVSSYISVPAVKKVVGAPARSFPPPLPTLAHRGDGSNVQMRSHRQDGRLVLEAVSVPSNNCLRAERQDGRLLLTFSGSHVDDAEVSNVELEENGFEQGDVIDDDEEEDQESELEEDEDEEEEDDDDVDMTSGDGGMITYVAGQHKFLNLTRTSNSPTWPRMLNRVVNTLEDEEEVNNGGYLAHGLNPYVYSWRSEPGPDVVQVVVERKRAGKVEEGLIPLYLRGCNIQPRRSFLLWEPHCIATS